MVEREETALQTIARVYLRPGHSVLSLPRLNGEGDNKTREPYRMDFAPSILNHLLIFPILSLVVLNVEKEGYGLRGVEEKKKISVFFCCFTLSKESSKR